MQFFNKTNIEFVNRRKSAFILSIVIIVVGLASMIVRGGLNYGIDFTGGVSLELDLTPEAGDTAIEADELRDALKKNDIKDAEIQTISQNDRIIYLVKTQGTQTKNKS